MFENKRFAQAVHCFHRANALKEKDIANAYLLREQAERMSTQDKKAHERAADAFENCANESARQKERFMRLAGQCYAKAGYNERAARAFLVAKRYNEAAHHFKKAALFDDAVSVVKSNRDMVDDDVAESVYNVARIFYLRKTDAQLE